jgi:transposase
MKKRKFTIEFKKQAVDLALSLGNISEAAKQLGVLDSSIHNWKKKFNTLPGGIAKSDISVADLEELKRLRRENAEQKKVIHILKAAAAFFSQDHLK